MKDPCLECLVRVTCWQECDEKRNYAILLANAMRNFKSGGARIKYHKQFSHYLDLTEEHLVRRSMIKKRARLMSEEN